MLNSQRGSRVTALSMLYLGARWQWVVNATPRLPYPREREAVPNVQDAGRASCLFWRGKKNHAFFEAGTPHHPGRCIQLCRLSYLSVVKIW